MRISTHKKISIYRTIILFLVIGIIVLGYQYEGLKLRLNTPVNNEPDITSGLQDAPHYKEVMDIIKPLDYTVIPSLLLQPDLKLTVDFTMRTWTLKNFHQYHPDGSIVLEYDRFGLCGELSEFTYERIKPLFKDGYTIKFASVAESGFFLDPNDSHDILIIYDNSNSRAYLLDPTFHRYGPVEDFHDYLYFKFSEKIEGIDNKQTDVTFNMGHGMPIIIRNDFISMLSIEDSNGKFDKDNFTLAVLANRRYEYTGRYIFTIRKQDGHVDVFEDKTFENKTLPPNEIAQLKKTFTTWFYSI